MSESIFIFCIYPLLICMFSIAMTYKIGTFYALPMVTFLIFLMFNVTLYDPSFFFWVGMYTVFSFIISYITILFVKGYKAVEKER
ncbi:YbeF family protein [Bacillus toyonensis]|uniref:YbeF family protein n=1 Tax=Bacillus toyonensis TaxID=155322 RepID=UPI0018A17DC3|nr:YbeF family protein [Bacillus toyonensis]MBF7149846.1 YbeF family protein [Bacillus toyonensis]MEC2350590.1 YbeF family protein [Bacillus toyonensis]MED3189190.1 YbeF family protein [Bacillus toyonensis]